MAIIKCPECGKEISDSALSCPHCGKPFLFLKNCHKKYPNLKLIILILILPPLFCYYANYRADYYDNDSFEGLLVYYLLILCSALPALFIRCILLKRPIKVGTQWISLLISWPLLVVAASVAESASSFRIDESIGVVMFFASIPLTNAILLAGTGKFILFKKDVCEHKKADNNHAFQVLLPEQKQMGGLKTATALETVIPINMEKQQGRDSDKPQQKEETEIDLTPEYPEESQDVEGRPTFFKSEIWRDLRLPLLWIPGIAVAVNFVLIMYFPFSSGFQDIRNIGINIGISEIIMFSVFSAIISNLTYLIAPLVLRFLILKTPMKSMGLSTLGATFILGLGARLLLMATGLSFGKTANVPILQGIAIYYVLTAGHTANQFIYKESNR